MEALRRLSAQLVALSEGKPQANSAELGQVAECCADTGCQCKESEGAAAAVPATQSAGGVRSTEGALCLPEPRRAARQEIPGPPSSRVLRRASSEMEQMHNYISSNGTELHEAIGNRDTP